MDLNSQDYIYFVIASIIFYWITPFKYRKYTASVFSTLFILSWGVKACVIFLISVLVDYLCAKKIHSFEDKKKRTSFLLMAIGVNVLMWGYYKTLGLISGDNLLIPIGISYYTFQTLGYTFAVYWKRIEPAKSFMHFYMFNSFYPQLAAGPVERPESILPQLDKKIKFNEELFKSGMFLILLGYFKKWVIADRLNFYYLEYAKDPTQYYGLTHVFLMYIGFFVMYCNISSYTDLARGVGKLFGIDIMRNFIQPYLAKDPADLWSRWHISITRWHKDYIFMPMFLKSKNIYTSLVVVFVFFAFWHMIRVEYAYLAIFYVVLHIVYLWLEKYVPSYQKRTPLWIQRFIFFQFIILSGPFLIEAGPMQSWISYQNMFIFDQSSLSYILQKDFIIAIVAIIIMLFIEQYEMKILEKKSPLWIIGILIFLVTVFRFNESYFFIYFRI